MDLGILISAAVGAFGGLVTTGTFVWNFSAKMTRLESASEQLRREHQTQVAFYRDALLKLERDFDEHVKEQNRRWNEINRLLGQIEGEISRKTRGSPSSA